MPSAQSSQSRIARIKELVEWGKDKNTISVDDLLEEARNRFPYNRESTLMSYAQAALRIIQRSGD